MKPPYEITTDIYNTSLEISQLIGEIKTSNLTKLPTVLRKSNRIRTIQSSLEIEGNTLSIEQITDMLDGVKITAPLRDIIEVKNAIACYDKFKEFNTYELDSLLEAHGILMKDLVNHPGRLRASTVGVMKGEQIAHLAPPPTMVYPLMNDLFSYLRESEDNLLIKSCVFHYEFECIHPFPDGNGRMGRLWQSKILTEYAKVFEFLPIEILIKERQKTYYEALATSDREGKSTAFIAFMLEIIRDTLEHLLQTQRVSPDYKMRLDDFSDIVKEEPFSRQDYLRHNKNISTATASRDLKQGVTKGLLLKNGDKRTTTYSYMS